jgi:hypothetical protein
VSALTNVDHVLFYLIYHREALSSNFFIRGARLYQARHEWGLNIESRVEIVDGEKHSWFRLVEEVPKLFQAATTSPARTSLSLFGSAANGSDLKAEAGRP